MNIIQKIYKKDRLATLIHIYSPAHRNHWSPKDRAHIMDHLRRVVILHHRYP